VVKEKTHPGTWADIFMEWGGRGRQDGKGSDGDRCTDNGLQT
jgi:hypothetical protein